MRIGFTAGSFDLCHAGHMIMFRDARAQCDYLIVGLQADPTQDIDYRMTTGGKLKNLPIMSIKERLEILSGIRYIDEVFTYSTEPELYERLAKMKYDVRILGSDWEGKPYTGHDLPHTPYFHRRDHNYSTSALRERVYDAEKANRE